MADHVQALAGIKILDLSQGIAGPFATRMLADYGADVIKVEPPGGDISRTYPPFADDEPGMERSGTFLYLNTNKRSVVLDLGEDEDRATLAALAREADIVVESFSPRERQTLGLDWGFFHALSDRLTLVSVSDFGLSGPYKDYELTELALYGFAGSMYTQGLIDREPTRMAGISALIECGWSIATGLLGAVLARDKGMAGQHVEVSLAEIQFGSPDRRVQTMLTAQFSGHKTTRMVRDARGRPSGIYPCLDGFVEFTAAAQHPARVEAMLGHAEWLDDPAFRDPDHAMDPDVVEQWNAHFMVWCLERTKQEIWAAARECGVLCGPLYDPSDLRADPVFESRGAWATVEHATLGQVRVPGRPFVMPEGGYALRRGAPALGEHSEEVRREGFGDDASDASGPRGASRSAPAWHGTPGTLPLSGLRIVDLTLVIAGTYGTMVLADLGAEVIKIENANFMQPMTRSIRRQPAEDPLTLSAYPHGQLGERPWNYWATQVSMYRNKKSVTIDYRKPEGLELLRQLVAQSDAVCENNAVGVLEKFGITYEWLKEANPDIICVRSPAFSLEGPYTSARALGWHVEAVGGLTAQRGYEDLDPSVNNNIYAGDFVAGLNLAGATMTAVRYRNLTGKGQMVEMSQAEGVMPMAAHELMDYALNGRDGGPKSNRDAHGRFPCGVYPARSPGSAETGDDRWICIHVRTDEEWAALREAMGDPAWARDERFATNDGRREHHTELDRLLAGWTSERDDYEMMHLLQSHGVVAAPVLEASRMVDEPHLKARGFLRPQGLDSGDTYMFPGPLYAFHGTPITFFQDPVTLGEHNTYVYRELLGMDQRTYEGYVERGDAATNFNPSLP